MKVLWFTNTPSLASQISGKNLQVGGWISSLEKLIKQENQIELAISFFSNDFNVNRIEEHGVRYYPIKTNKFSILERYLYIQNERLFLDKFLDVVKDFNPDLIHIFGTENAFAGIATYTKIPIIVHLQGLMWPNQQSWKPQQITLRQVFLKSSFLKYAKGSGVYRSYFRVKQQAEREIINIKSIQYFTGRTEWDKAYIRLINPEASYFHIDEVLRDPFYEAAWYYPSDKKLRMLSTLGPNIYKGLDTVFMTAQLLSKSNIDFEWNIVGINQSHEIVKLFEKLLKLDVKKLKINFLGKKNPNEIILLMKSSHLFIHPSHIDNSPNSVCEAMMVGIPVIAANVGGLNSLINDNYTGLLYKDYDINYLTNLILNIYEDKVLLECISEKARITAKNRHNRAKIKEDTFELYKRIIDKL